MAARKNKIRHDDETRAKIKASQLVNRLTDHALGNCEMSSTQVTAALGLLKKALPDLSSAEVKNETTVHYVARMPAKPADMGEWQKRYAPPNQTIQ
jgi:hypothetical protein